MVRYALIDKPDDWGELSTGPWPEITKEEIALHTLAGHKPKVHSFGCSRCTPFENYKRCSHDGKNSDTYQIVVIERD